MKKITLILLSVILTFGSVISVFANDITVTVDGDAMEFDVAPAVINDRTMVPMRKIFERLGAEVEWVDPIIIAAKGSQFISLKIGSSVMITQDMETESEQKKTILDCAPVIIDGRTLIPIRAVSEALGAQVEWIGETKTVKINTEGDIKEE